MIEDHEAVASWDRYMTDADAASDESSDGGFFLYRQYAQRQASREGLSLEAWIAKVARERLDTERSAR